MTVQKYLFKYWPQMPGGFQKDNNWHPSLFFLGWFEFKGNFRLKKQGILSLVG